MDKSQIVLLNLDDLLELERVLMFRLATTNIPTKKHLIKPSNHLFFFSGLHLVCTNKI